MYFWFQISHSLSMIHIILTSPHDRSSLMDVIFTFITLNIIMYCKFLLDCYIKYNLKYYSCYFDIYLF